MYEAKIEVKSGQSGEVLAHKTLGPFHSYDYASGVAKEEITALWAELHDDEGLVYTSMVSFK